MLEFRFSFFACPDRRRSRSPLKIPSVSLIETSCVSGAIKTRFSFALGPREKYIRSAPDRNSGARPRCPFRRRIPLCKNKRAITPSRYRRKSMCTRAWTFSVESIRIPFGKGRRARFAQSSTGSERIRFTVAFPHRVPAHSRLFAFSSFACRTADRLADVAGQSQQKRVTDTKWREYCNFVTLCIYNTILEHEKIHLCICLQEEW